MSMAIKKMDKPIINIPKSPEDTSSRVDIFIWGKSTRKLIGSISPSNKNNKKIYIMIVHHCTPRLEGNLKGVVKYKTI